MLRRGRQLEYFTVGYNCLEGVASVVAGLIAESISLVGFGLDSFIEVTSAAALIWRFGRDRDPVDREFAERRSLRIVGVCFLALAAYIAYDLVIALLKHGGAGAEYFRYRYCCRLASREPLLANAKRNVAAAIGSTTMQADARQTDFCTSLSAILVSGLLLNALVG